EFLVEAGVVERRRGFGSEGPQNRDTSRREYARSEIVFQIEEGDQLALLYKWETQKRAGLLSMEVWVRVKGAACRGIVENDVFLRAGDIQDEGFGQSVA